MIPADAVLIAAIVEIDRQQHAISGNTRRDQPHRQSPFNRTGRP
jgi:hypothetical protein